MINLRSIESFTPYITESGIVAHNRYKEKKTLSENIEKKMQKEQMKQKERPYQSWIFFLVDATSLLR